jgi:hypothetical protein
MNSLPRKAGRVKMTGSVPETDTGGRAQACQGERVKAPEGTRQKSGRNFGIRPPADEAGAASDPLATV